MEKAEIRSVYLLSGFLIFAYALPFGLLGKAFDLLALKRDLEQVLEHRRARLQAMLSQPT